MRGEWIVGAAAATASLLALGGCGLFGSAPANLTDASGEECVVLATALGKITDDWRSNPGGRTLRIDAYAISAGGIDSDYDSRLSGLLPPKDAKPIDVADCGTPLATISNRLDFVWPDHELPTGDRRSCWRSDGGWVSRAAIDAEQTHAAVLYTDDVCGERYWLVRLKKDSRGVWYADAPEPLEREAVMPSQSG